MRATTSYGVRLATETVCADQPVAHGWVGADCRVSGDW